MRGVAWAPLLLAALALCPRAAADEPGAADSLGLAALSPEELFIRASSSELQFEGMREPSRKLLVARPSESIPYLVTRLDTDDPRERLALESILTEIGEPSVLPLVSALGSELVRTDTTRGARLAASILGQLGDARAADALVAAADHPDWKVRAAAAGSLGRIGDPRSATPLAHLLADPNEIVRADAAVALGRLAEETAASVEPFIAELVSAVDDPWYAVRRSAGSALAALGETAVPPLAKRALEPGEPGRANAIIALGETGSRRVLPTLRKLAASDDWAARAFAARAMARIPHGARENRLLRRLSHDPQPFVAQSARNVLDLPASN